MLALKFFRKRAATNEGADKAKRLRRTNRMRA